MLSFHEICKDCKNNKFKDKVCIWQHMSEVDECPKVEEYEKTKETNKNSKRND